MTWTYDQTTGELKHNGVLVGVGYSGAGTTAASGRNNPAMQQLPFQGPIPTGAYLIGAPYAHPQKGPMTMNLTPVGHNALGRTEFRIHGNNALNNASQGCVIMNHQLRTLIANSVDNQLIVVSSAGASSQPASLPAADVP